MVDWIDINELKPEEGYTVQVKGNFGGNDHAFIDSNGVWSVDGVTHWRNMEQINYILDDLDKLEKRFRG